MDESVDTAMRRLCAERSARTGTAHETAMHTRDLVEQVLRQDPRCAKERGKTATHTTDSNRKTELEPKPKAMPGPQLRSDSISADELLSVSEPRLSSASKPYYIRLSGLTIGFHVTDSAIHVVSVTADDG